MKLEATSFNDFSLKVVRDFLRGARYSDYNRVEWAVEKHGPHFVDTLIEHGLAERNNDADTFRLTELGIRISNITMIPRMNRVAVDQLVVNVEKRALEVNSDERFGMRFAMLGIFGSVLNEQAEDFGDLDVVYRLERKPHWEGRGDDLLSHHLKHFPQDENVSHYSFRWSQQRPLQHVKARQGRISLHSEFDLELLETKHAVPHKLLFGVRVPSLNPK